MNKYGLSHPEKILYPEIKITKLQIAKYYDSIKEWILPYIIKRPLTFVRCPTNYHQCFFQKHLNHEAPQGLHAFLINEKDSKEKYIYIKDKQGLFAMTQLGVLEIHLWGSSIKNIEHPDTMVFDLDPAPNVPWKRIVNAAYKIKDLLQDFSLRSFVKSTGGKGLHVVVPIKPTHTWKEIKFFSHALVDYLVLKNSKEYIGKMSKAARQHKIFIDYLRNQRGSTFIAPYSTRSRENASVSTPLHWDELSNDIRDNSYNLLTIPKRMQSLKLDPWSEYFKIKQSLDLKA